jgi:hypothetical protein
MQCYVRIFFFDQIWFPCCDRNVPSAGSSVQIRTVCRPEEDDKHLTTARNHAEPNVKCDTRPLFDIKLSLAKFSILQFPITLHEARHLDSNCLVAIES